MNGRQKMLTFAHNKNELALTSITVVYQLMEKIVNDAQSFTYWKVFVLVVYIAIWCLNQIKYNEQMHGCILQVTSNATVHFFDHHRIIVAWDWGKKRDGKWSKEWSTNEKSQNYSANDNFSYSYYDIYNLCSRFFFIFSENKHNTPK